MMHISKQTYTLKDIAVLHWDSDMYVFIHMYMQYIIGVVAQVQLQITLTQI